MNQIGIWIDEKNAKIVSIIDGKDNLHTITSEVEDYHVSGGSGTKFKGGPQQVVQDSRYLERKNHQLALYFKEVVQHIANADEVMIFGPAQTGIKLKSEISEKHPQIDKRISLVEKADSMTDNQIKARVRAYYSSIK